MSGEGQKERELQAGSALASTECNVGLELRNHEIMT